MKFAQLINYKNGSFYFLNQPVTEETAREIDKMTKTTLDRVLAKTYIEQIGELLIKDSRVQDTQAVARKVLRSFLNEFKEYNENELNAYLADCPLILTHSYDSELSRHISGYRFELKENVYLYLPKEVLVDKNTRYPNLGSIVFNNGVITARIPLDNDTRERIMDACAYRKGDALDVTYEMELD